MVADSLGVLPENDVKLFIGVEGSNDINFLKHISSMLKKERIINFNLDELDRKGNVIFFPLGGSNLSLWTSRLLPLGRPEFHLYDRDTEPSTPAKYQDQADEINRHKNCTAKITNKREIENYLHEDAIRLADSKISLTVEDFIDLPLLIAQIKHENTENEKKWHELDEKNIKKKISSAKKFLNNQVVQNMSLEMLQKRDPPNEVISWFKEMEMYLT